MIAIRIVTNDINKYFKKKKYRGQCYLLEANQDGIVRYFVASGVDVNKIMYESLEIAGINSNLLYGKGKTYKKILGEGWEVLVFGSNKEGDFLGCEVCGGKGITHSEAIEELRQLIRSKGLEQLWGESVERSEEITAKLRIRTEERIENQKNNDING